jgi:hypothetical protein
VVQVVQVGSRGGNDNTICNSINDMMPPFQIQIRLIPISQLCFIFIFQLSLVRCHVYSDSFPTYDEYDYSILDPEHIYGAPYGGYSRATRSRLASLPLFLPDLYDNNPSDNPLHMEVRDAAGRLFVCRVYHEDELDPESLGESMFDVPKLKALEREEDNIELGMNLIDSVEEIVENAELASTEDKQGNRVLKIQDALSELDGVCSQVDTGWWSYEICFGKGESFLRLH